jgi:hypothetical protein
VRAGIGRPTSIEDNQMKKLKSLLCALALAFCLAAAPIARADGNMPSGGFVEQQGDAPDGFSWSFIAGLWYLLSSF